MEARYPNSNRTFTKLADMHVCGADMHIAHKTMATDPEHLAKWEELMGILEQEIEYREDKSSGAGKTTGIKRLRVWLTWLRELGS